MSTTPHATSEGAYSPDQLLAGDAPLRSENVTVLSGENVVRGSVIGRQTTSTVPTTGTAAGGNTGNGTVTGVAAGGTDLQEGTYTLRCFEAATDGGSFEVIAPDGEVVGVAVVGEAFESDHLDLTVNDGGTDFAVGDTFTVAVSGSGKYLLSVATATDGSQVPVGIMGADTDASSADKIGPMYIAGDFNERALTLGTGHTLTTVRNAFRGTPIFIQPSVAE